MIRPAILLLVSCLVLHAPEVHAGVFSRAADAVVRLALRRGSRRTGREVAETAASRAVQVTAKRSVAAKAAGTALDVLERHPRTLTAVTGVGTVLLLRESLFGPSGESTGQPGFVDRVLDRLQRPLAVLTAVLGTVLALWGGVRIWGAWKREKSRIRAVQRPPIP